VGENPPDNATEIRVSCGLYEKDWVEASEGQGQFDRWHGRSSRAGREQ